MKAEQYQDELKEVNGILVHIVTYKIGDEFYCHIDNADPGATIARAAGSTVEEARQKAMKKATERLEKVK
jgi:uncharacterized protein YktB (UPF0637 family)